MFSTMSIPPGDPDDLVPCPFDPVHMVRRKRMQYHIMKCQQNMDMRKFRKCPFNAQHVIPVAEYEAHVKSCEGRAILEREMIYARQSQNPEIAMNQGNLHVPPSNFVVPESTESWDEDNAKVVIEDKGLGQLRTTRATFTNPRQAIPSVPRTEKVMRDPPKPRLPMSGGAQGTELQVYDYSLSSNGDASRPKPPTMGRGRGRGRGVASQRDTQPRPGGAADDFPMMPPLVTYPSSPQTNPQNGLPTLGKLPPPTTNRDPGVAHVSTRGTKYPPAEESLSPPPVEVQATPAESEAEIRKKKIRKLKKMLRQIEQIEERESSGMALDEDQMVKVARKKDVVFQLEKLLSM